MFAVLAALSLAFSGCPDAREAPVFYDNAEGSFSPKYTGRKNAQYVSDTGSNSIASNYALYYHDPAPYSGYRPLYICGGTTSVYNSVNWPLSTATFSVNGVVKQTFAAQDSIPSWQKATFSLNAGTNVLRWQKRYGLGAFTPDGGITITQECLYILLYNEYSMAKKTFRKRDPD
jgi:hypothetical protein